MEIYDEYFPDADLSNFVRGTLIHQILDVDSYQKEAPYYQSDRADIVKLSMEHPKFYSYLELTTFFQMKSFNISLTLKNEIESIDHMVLFETSSAIDGATTQTLLLKLKDSDVTRIYLTDTEVKNEGSSVKTLTKQLTINVGKISKIITW